jgi:hypothetical protein
MPEGTARVPERIAMGAGMNCSHGSSSKPVDLAAAQRDDRHASLG